MGKAAGISLIEMLFVVSLTLILSIGFCYQIPRLWQQKRLNQFTEQLNNKLQYARSEALIRHQCLQLVPLTNQSQLQQVWQNSAYWVITRCDTDVSFKNFIYQYKVDVDKHIQYQWNRTQSAIRFAANGYLASQPGSFLIMSRGLAEQIIITISLSGRIKYIAK